MATRSSCFKSGCAAAVVLMLVSCGGGGSNSASSSTVTQSGDVAAATATPAVALPAGAPQPTGNTATDGLNWFNYRRQLLGEPALSRVAAIDTAALNHSQYQQLNNTITHTETIGNNGFTGATLAERLAAAKFRFSRTSYAYGEVISSTVDQSGFNAAEDLITAIYHRFAIFEPAFRQAGTGSAVSSSGRTYFTTDFVVDGLAPTLGKGGFLVYPANAQQDIPTNFFSDFESPDPVPNRNQVGYPISLHADITSSVTVQSFTLRPHNGAALQTVLLQHATDTETPVSAAAIIPLEVLAPQTSYDVQFVGAVDGVAVNRSWSFKTR